MTFKEAFEAMKHGAKVKLPSWAGYWFWCIPAQSILMHTKDGKDIDVRSTECPDYTFTNICSDEWIFANDTNCPALGGEATFSFSEAIKQLKKGRKVARKQYNRYVRKFPTSIFLNVTGYEKQSYSYLEYDVSEDAPQNLFGDK